MSIPALEILVTKYHGHRISDNITYIEGKKKCKIRPFHIHPTGHVEHIPAWSTAWHLNLLYRSEIKIEKKAKCTEVFYEQGGAW